MQNIAKKFKKVVVLDTVIFYPEHRKLLNSIAEEVLEYPSSLPERLEKQYEEHPEFFLNKKCYMQIATDDIPLQLLMNRVEGADCIISCWAGIPDEILKLNPQLKLILFWTHEKEHRINIKLAEELGIAVANIPDYGTDSVAEVVFAGLWELIKRNYPRDSVPETEDEIMHSIMNEVFDRYRQLTENEKYTRAGKFTHHFHKLGLVKFDFTKKNIDELIPEKLIENKKIGLLNISNTRKTINALKSFDTICRDFDFTDSNLATYYKFLSENRLIFLDSKNISKEDLEKTELMFKDKIIDIQNFTTASYSFDKKIFGIVGLGRIGSRVAKIAKNLGFKVIYYSKTRNEDIEKSLGIKFIDLKKLAKISDIVSIHVSAHRAENLFDEKLINLMREKTIFINTADGNAIDQQALTKRMLNNEIFAYLDVYPGLPRKDILGIPMKDKSDWKIHKILANNVLAYRTGWKTQESIRVKTYKLLGLMIDFLIENKGKYNFPSEL
jgi:lactate dehydrogenase-like 2-hydroxyacid dehydrogenase